MKKVVRVALILLVFCCSLFCGCVPACGGVGWYTSGKKLRGQLDGLAECLAAPQNYYITVTRYEESEEGNSLVSPNSSEEANYDQKKVIFKALYLFTESGVCYCELDLKTGGAAHYTDGVLKSFYDGEEIVTTGGKTFAEDWSEAVIATARGELLKPVQNNQKGYHYLFFNYDFISYANRTEVSLDGVTFTAVSVSFHVGNDEPKYREYSITLKNSTCIYSLCDNISGLNAGDVALRYTNFKDYGQS